MDPSTPQKPPATGLFQDLLAAATADSNPLLRGDTEIIEHPAEDPNPVDTNPQPEVVPAATPRRSSARTKTADPASTDAPAPSPAPSPSKAGKKKATPATPRRTATVPGPAAPTNGEVDSVRADVASLHTLLREVSNNTATTQATVNELSYLVKDAQNEIMKLQVVQDKVKELAKSDNLVQATLVGEIKPILDGFSAFMEQTRSRLNQVEATADRTAVGPEKRRRVDSPPPTPPVVAAPIVAAPAAPGPFVFPVAQPMPASTATPQFTFAAPTHNTFIPRAQAPRVRTMHYIKFGPIDTNGCAPLFVIQQMVDGLTNGMLFSKLIKHASIFPGTTNYILATLYSHEHAAGVAHAWNTTRSAAHASITAEIAGQSQGN